ncbi:protein artichoke [Orussus abietinus]|uniref:protein artichoke n=1 Tax=Orussus abietinus TaxID=222816 RepID=UPI0006265F38|nr:protein artichoke [Orussus abietinus]
MARSRRTEGLLVTTSFLVFCCTGVAVAHSNTPMYACPPQEVILPCRCSTRDSEIQIWCSHSELPKVLEGLEAVGRYASRSIDELILENNNLPSLPGRAFGSLRVMRLMLRNNRLERVSSGWLEGLHGSLLELFLVEPDLRSLPIDSLENLHSLEAITLQSKSMKRLPKFSGLRKLRYLQVNSPALLELTPRNFRDLPSLEQLHVFGSKNLVRLEAGLLRDLPRLTLVNITECGINWIHPRAMIALPELRDVSLVGNAMSDAAMVGRAVADLPMLTVVRLDRNRLTRLGETSFVDLPTLSRLYLSRNAITEIFPGAFQRLPALRVVDLNHNLVRRIHPDFFPRGSASGLEEMWLVNNDLGRVAELRSVLEALPRLKFLDVSRNRLEEIPFGALRGHPTLERLHLDHNGLSFLQRETFTAMPALRELRLRNNSLSNLLEGPFWNLPALKGLDLAENYFRHLDPRLLKSLPNLRRLDLSGNAIGLVDPKSFLGTPSLEHVNVSGNALSVLHPMTFSHLTNLYELDISRNRLVEVVPGLPRNIEHLHLSLNRIVALPSMSSRDLALPSLRSLDISANGIERIPPGTLSELPNLRKLDLAFNALVSVEDGTFDGLLRLERLILDENRLMSIHGRGLRPVRSLSDLSLSGNRLEVLRPDVFQENSRLQKLDLSGNGLAQIPHAVFTGTRELRELYASHNALTELPGSLYGLTALRILDLSYNELNGLSPEALSSLSSLLELKLTRNKIRELRSGAFDGLPKLSLVDLESNELMTIERGAVRALPELQALRLGKNLLQMIPGGAFMELPLLRSVELQENRLREILPDAFVDVPHLLFLNLSYNLFPDLQYVGLEGLTSLEVLDLSHNRLSRVASESLANMEWLVELKMDDNRICGILGSPFDDMPRLRVLSLRSNRMASVAENAFKKLRSNIAVLDIDGNPLSCTCGMLWLRGWLQQASAEGPRCADGSLFREVRLSRQECQGDTRRLEPVVPGCETEMIDGSAISSSSLYGGGSLWMDLKEATTPQVRPVHGANGTEYLYDYEYLDYVSENSGMGGPSSTATPEPSTIISTSPETPRRPVEITGATSSSKVPSKNLTKTSPSSTGLPSPSSSGFTFFGVPLPSLSFDLWGNSKRKSQRKNDARPGRGHFGAFPPTEPEIHRGGFVPLPRGESGFMPMPDPRQTRKKNLTEKPRVSDNIRTTPRPLEKRLNASLNLLKRVNSSESRGLRATEASSSTEAYETMSYRENSTLSRTSGGSREGHTSKVVWTTPKFSTKESATATMEVFGSKETSSWDFEEDSKVISREPTASSVKMDGPDVEIQAEAIRTDRPQALESSLRESSTSTPKESTTCSTTRSSNAMEASALSAFLVPGGQIPLGVRSSGRPTITKVSSPSLVVSTKIIQNDTESSPIDFIETARVESTKYKEKTENESTLSPEKRLREIEDSAFSWYFQHYNDSNVEPYVGEVYKNIGVAKCGWWTLLWTQVYILVRMVE